MRPYVLGVFVFIFCIVLFRFLLPYLYPVNSSGDDNFITVIIAFIILVIVIPVVMVFYFWKRGNASFTLGIATAPIVVPMILGGFAILFFKLTTWGAIDPNNVISQLEDFKKKHGNYPNSLQEIGIRTPDINSSQKIKYALIDSKFIFCEQNNFDMVDIRPGSCYDSETQKWEYWNRIKLDD